MSPAERNLPVETLLADAGWVRRLAARLVADPGTADELAQETLVAAWRHPPAQGTPARAWLGRVLRNFARQRNRRDTARTARERTLARGPSAPDDLLERAELAQRLARIVLELEEPYRTTVLRRFFDGWSAEEIARVEGTNASTVRSRLERALAKLRERLERERGREWLSALAPLAGLEKGILMATGTKLAIGLCAAGLCGWILWPRSEPLAPALEAPPAAAPPTRTALESPAVPERKPQPLTVAVEPKPAAVKPSIKPLAPGAIEGIVLRRSSAGDAPIAGAEVTLHEDYDPRMALAALELPALARTRSAADGTFRFLQRPAGTYNVRTHVGDKVRDLRAVLREREPGVRVQFLFGSSRIHGTLRGLDGAPLEGLAVRLSGCKTVLQGVPGAESGANVVERHFSDESAHREVCASDAVGAFAFEELADGDYYVDLPAAEGFWRKEWPARMDRVVLLAGDDLEIDAGPSTGPAHWTGALRTANGELATGGGMLFLERDSRSAGGSTLHTFVEVRLQQDGKFDATLEPARWTVALSLASNSDVRLPCGEIDVPPGGLERDLPLPGTRLFGIVLDEATQQPLAGYAGELRISVHKQGENYSAAMHEAQLDDESGYAIDMLGEGDWEAGAYPIDLAAPGKKVSFRIEKGEASHRLDLVVRKP